DVGFARLVGQIVEGVLRVGVVEVDRGRHQTAVEGQDAGGSLDGAGRAQQVAVDGFGGAHSHVVRVVPEDRFDRFGLGHVTEFGRGAVSVDVADVVGVDPAHLQGVAHRANRAFAFRMRSGEVV